MAPRSGRNRRRSDEQAGQPVGTFCVRSIYWDWTVSFLLLLAVEPASPVESVEVLVSRPGAALAPDWAWVPVLMRWEPLLRIGDWPYWLFAAGMSILIVQALKHVFRESVSFERYVFLIALSLLAGPTDLMPGAILLVGRQLLSSVVAMGVTRRSMTVFGGLAFSAIAFCLEFTVVLFVLLYLWGAHSGDRTRRVGLLLPVVTVVGCGLAASASTGFAAALARPVSWLEVPEQLIPMSPFLAEGSMQLLTAGLAALCVVNVWRAVWRMTRIRGISLLVIALLSLLALACRYYTWLSLLGLLCVNDWSETRLTAANGSRKWQYAAAIVTLACLITKAEVVWMFALTGHWPDESVDPAQWNAAGSVLLMEPAEAGRWQSRAIKERHQVVIDDRWDLFANEYPMYLRLCRDISEIRNSHYLLSDETWGGYRHWIDRWQPSLLEVPASDTDSLRRLSLSPHWKVMGIDSRRVVLGLRDLPQNTAQIQTMSTLFAELEWPSPQFDGDLRGAIVALSDQQRMTVAKVLLALRLPYAAIRLLPERHRDNDLIQAFCHFELAHRAYRQTRMPSLLDQYRAVSQLRELQERGRLTARETLRVALGLEELGERQSAIDFASRVVGVAADAGSLESRAAMLMERCRSDRETEDAAENLMQPEDQVRRALLSGRSQEARVGLSRLPGSVQGVFRLLVSASDADSEHLYRSLIAQLNRRDFPPELRAEVTFYLGSLAIEIGDSPGAAQALMESIRIDATLPLNSLGRVSLSGLLKNERP